MSGEKLLDRAWRVMAHSLDDRSMQQASASSRHNKRVLPVFIDQGAPDQP
jgi:hypothetical protein